MNLKPVLVLLISCFCFSSFGQMHKDCDDALQLCGDSPFTIEVFEGTGDSDDGVTSTCLIMEFSSTWIAINPITGGDLVFEITPAEDLNDLDFAVYQLTNGDCETKEIIRCMASGETAGAPVSSNEPCQGSTGLAFGETDTEELPGCSDGDNNFLAPLQVQPGDQYILLINDFSSNLNSFTLSFGGSAELDCITLTSNENISNIDQAPLFTVNQNNDQLSIKTQEFTGSGTLILYAIDGSKVYEKIVFAHELIHLDFPFPIGSYFATLRTQHGAQSEKILFLK